MTYTPTNWVNEVPTTTPIKYKITDDTAGIIGASATIEIVTPVTPGTPFNSANMNHIEQALAAISAPKAIKAANIDDSTITPTQIANRTRKFFISSGLTMPESGITPIFSGFVVPMDYASGLTLKPVIKTNGLSGWALFDYSMLIGKAADNLSTSYLFDTIDVSTLGNTLKYAATVNSGFPTTPAVGDVFLLEFTRYGAGRPGLPDTAGEVTFVGWEISYTADS